MPEKSWERVLVEALGDASWDEATELVSMIMDEHLPALLSDDAKREIAVGLVLALVRDVDYRRCAEGLLAASHFGGPT